MTPYRNLSGQSGVAAYELYPVAIVVRFHGGDRYEYTEQSAGTAAVAAMKLLAQAGRGLSTFIARHHPPYARRLL